MNIVILDTETTGLTGKDEVIELAYITIDENFVPLHETVQRFKPSIAINPHAQAVHGIEFKNLLGMPPSSKLSLEPVDYMIGHNISFDKRLLIQSNPELKSMLETTKYIDTKTLAKLVEKRSDTIKFLNHKLDTLVEYYYPDTPIFTSKYHDALNDCKKVMLVLSKIRETFPALDTVEKVFEFQQVTKGK